MGHDGGAEGHETTPEVLVVTGPTASGKSSLAVALAERFDGAVVNADSMQVYRDLEILTARPDPAATRRVPHCLYGIMDGAEICSAGHWRGLALAEIERVRAMGRLPIVTGGTGLYLKALTEGLAILPEVPESVRSAARRVMADRGAEAFHRELADRDPEAAARLHPSDRQRLIRAWEVLEVSGRSILEWQRDPVLPAPDLRFRQVVLVPPRERLHAACDERFTAMVAVGALDEVRALLRRGLPADRPVMKAVGVAALAAHLAGDLALAEAIALGRRATRRYAKRQMTWLRTQGPLRPREDSGGPCERKNHAPVIINEQYSESLNTKIFQKIRQLGLTG